MINELIQRLAWLGHDSYRLDGDPVIYFDPYEIKSKTPADIILISHEHFDHCSPADVAKIHPKDAGMLGFIVSMGGVRVYHAGDTDFISEMNDIETDIALLPVSGTYVMTADEAIQAARAIDPKVAIPMHYGAIVGDQTDAEHFRDQLAGKIEVVILDKE